MKQNGTGKQLMTTFAGEVEKLHFKQRRYRNTISTEGIKRHRHYEESSGIIYSSIKF